MDMNTLWVGWRLLVGKRGGLGQAMLMATGMSLAVTLLLAVAAVPTAVADRQARDSVREWLLSGEPTDEPTGRGILAVGHDRLGEAPLTHLLVTGDSLGAIANLSMSLGDVMVSPALADSIAVTPSLADRLHGQIIGTLPPQLLTEPDELISLAYVEEGTVLSTGDAQRLPGDDPPPVDIEVSTDVMLVASVALLALALPVVIFIAAATRFGIERRRARVHTLSLAGAEVRQIRFFVLLESVFAASLGLLLGLALFSVIRPLIAELEVGGGSIFADALQPSPLLTGAIVVGVIIASVGASFVGTRRLHDSKVTESTRISWSGISLLALGGAALGIGAASPANSDAPHPLALTGMVLLAIGFALTTRNLVAVLGRAVGNRTGNGVALLASGQMRRSPAETSRPLIAVGAAVLLVAAFFTITGTLVRSSNPRYENIPKDRVIVEAAPETIPGIADQLEGYPGVDALVVQMLVGISLPDGTQVGRGVVADCESVQEAFEVAVGDCGAGVFVTSDTVLPADTDLVISSGAQASGEPLTTAVPYEGAVFSGAFPASVIVDPTMVSGEFQRAIGEIQVIARLDPEEARLEAVRTAIVSDYPTASIRSVAEIEDQFSASAREVRTLATIGLIAVLGMAAFSLAVGIGSHLLQRRNTYALLRAGGLTAGQIRSLVAIESTLPLAVFAALGSLLGVVSGVAVATSAGTEAVVPWPSVLGVYAGAVIASAIVWSGFAPAIDRLTSPTGLRFE